MLAQTLPHVSSPSASQLDTAALRGLDHEHGFQPLRVEGRLPADLRGTLYRNGPARFDIGTRPHWFDGTGAVSAVRLDGASAIGAVRITHTPSVDADQRATRAPSAPSANRPWCRVQRARMTPMCCPWYAISPPIAAG